MTVYVYDHETGKVVPKGTETRARGPGKPVNDELPEAVQSMADGRFYTSRARLRRSYLSSGNPQGVTYTEVGNDPARFRPPPPVRPDVQGVHSAIEKARARYARGERV